MARLVFAVLLSIALMIVDHRFDYLNPVRTAITTVTTPFQYVANIPNAFSGWADDTLISRGDLTDENQRLKDENLILNAKIQRLISLESENARLRLLLGTARKQRGRRVVAEVLSSSGNIFSHEILLNKGSSDEVYLGQAVVDSNGVMGQVMETSLLTSRVLLVTDNRHAVPVRVNRNGLRAIAHGSGNYNRLTLVHLPLTADIQEGDLLVSSGLGQKFPDGFPVGTVTSIIRDDGQPYADVTAAPSAQLLTSNQVLLIWPPEQLVIPGIDEPASESPEDTDAVAEDAETQP